MALARIITRSEACSRELASFLQSRGYAVETTSPDNVPASTADLELRVDTGSGDRLTASVIARFGDRSSTLEFVRELKAPIAAPASGELPEMEGARVEILAGPVVKSTTEHLSEWPRDGNAESALSLPCSKESPSTLKANSNFTFASSQIVSPMIAPLTRWRSNRPVGPPSPPPTPMEPRVTGAKEVVVPAIPTPVPTVPATEPNALLLASPTPVADSVSGVPEAFAYQTSERIPSLFGNVAIVLAIMALLVTLAVGFGLYRDKKSLSIDKVANATSASDAKDAGNHSDGGSPSNGLPVVEPKTKSDPATKTEPSTKAVGENKEFHRGSLRASEHVRNSGGDERVAKDTVVYLDRGAQPQGSEPSASRSQSRSHRDGVIAENTVTYFKGMNGASKPAKSK